MHDVTIVGAGPVGATLALALGDADLDVVVLDARRRGEVLRGERSLALSHGARLIFERLGMWTSIGAPGAAVTPITEIEISQAGGFGVTRLFAADHDLPALGYVVSYRALQAALDSALARTGTDIRHGVTAKFVGGASLYAAVDVDGADAEPAIARLAAVADGTGAAIAGFERKRHDYGQVAIVAKVWRDAPHCGLALERFTSDGVIALLPESDHYALIWTVTPARARSLAELDDGPFLASLAQHFVARANPFTRVADRRSFPLMLEFARTVAGGRCVVLGNAAQSLHPIAGQGFNLGLRDAYELAQLIRDSAREEIGERAMLARYAAMRRVDRAAGIAFTHGLVALFSPNRALLGWPRGLALTMLDSFTPLKRAFTRAMMFGM